MNYYPAHCVAAIRITGLIRHETTPALFDLMSTRMIKCAASLAPSEFIGWQMNVPVRGLLELSVFGSGTLRTDDLKWVLEKVAEAKPAAAGPKELPARFLYELYLPAAQEQPARAIGFGTQLGAASEAAVWPAYYPDLFSEVVNALRDEGAVFRAVIANADADAQAKCRAVLTKTWRNTGSDPVRYLGHGVRTAYLLALPAQPSIRLITVLHEAVPGSALRCLGQTDDPAVRALWDDPLRCARVLPDTAASIMMMEPLKYNAELAGIRYCEAPTKPIPAGHKNPADKRAVTVGRAVDAGGSRRSISIGALDLRRHWQIIGQTGTGKSSLLANTVVDAIKKGYGLTLLDPHGNTIDVIERALPAEYADRVRVVRLGDAENPVPLNIWSCENPTPETEEKTISDVCELFGSIFDPKNEGIVGPRYERWLSTFLNASLTFLGKHASLESVTVLSQSQDNMLKLYKAIQAENPQIAGIIREEYGQDKSSDFRNMLNWLLCKFQRIVSVEQLRKTLGAGGNALDLAHTIDTNTVTLIDLASPVIGSHAARIAGTFLLMQLWNAVTARGRRDLTHLCIVDEASLFTCNPMPRMLAEGRKFGLSMILCHQHTGQLTAQIRDALEANSANLSAFRLSVRDAAAAAPRFEDPGIPPLLSRLDAFNAITTLSVGGVQTRPFTLQIARPRQLNDGEHTANAIERRSIAQLSCAHSDIRALTAAEIQRMLDDPYAYQRWRSSSTAEAEEEEEDIPDFLARWTLKEEDLEYAG